MGHPSHQWGFVAQVERENALSQECTLLSTETAALCHYETPNTLGVVEFLKAYSPTSEEAWKCRANCTAQAIKCPDSSRQMQEQGANELGAECLKEINMR